MAARRSSTSSRGVFAGEGVETCFALLGDANMNFATRLAEARLPDDLCPARALRGRGGHGLCAQDGRGRRRDGHLRARPHAVDDGVAGGGAGAPAAGGPRGRGAARGGVVQSGHRPGALRDRDGRGLPRAPPCAGGCRRRCATPSFRRGASGARSCWACPSTCRTSDGPGPTDLPGAVARADAAPLADAAASRRPVARGRTRGRRRGASS